MYPRKFLSQIGFFFEHDIDESEQVMWAIIASLHTLTLIAVGYQSCRLYKADKCTFRGNGAVTINTLL